MRKQVGSLFWTWLVNQQQCCGQPGEEWRLERVVTSKTVVIGARMRLHRRVRVSMLTRPQTKASTMDTMRWPGLMNLAYWTPLEWLGGLCTAPELWEGKLATVMLWTMIGYGDLGLVTTTQNSKGLRQTMDSLSWKSIHSWLCFFFCLAVRFQSKWALKVSRIFITRIVRQNNNGNQLFNPHLSRLVHNYG